MLLRSHRPRRRARRGAPLALGLVVAATGLVVAPPATAATIDVSSAAELQSALALGCSNGTVVRFVADVNTGSTVQTSIGCDATIDINGHFLVLGPLAVLASTKLTIDDSTNPSGALGAGQLFVASPPIGRIAAINNSNAALVMKGGRVVVGSESPKSAAIGGGEFGVDAGSFSMTGGSLAVSSYGTGAAIGGAENGAGGTISVTGGILTASAGTLKSGAASDAAVIGGGKSGATGTVSITGGSVYASSDGGGGAGIGSGAGGPGTGSVTIGGNAQVAATGGPTGGAGIGSGSGTTTAPAVTITSAANVSGAAGSGGAGVGGGSGASASTVVVAEAAKLLAYGAGSIDKAGGAGVGGGAGGAGGTVTISGAAAVTAVGSPGGAGIGGGTGGAGATVAIDSFGVTKVAGGTAVGAGIGGPPAFGSLDLRSTLQIQPPPSLSTGATGGIVVRDSLPGSADEVTVGPAGILRGSSADGTDGAGASLTGTGQVLNQGTILLDSSLVSAPVKDRHHRIVFDTQGGSPAPAPITVFASTVAGGGRALPPPPTKAGEVFQGWNTELDGTGSFLVDTVPLPGSSADGTPVVTTYRALWTAAATITGPSKTGALVGEAVDYRPVLGGRPAPSVALVDGVLPAGLGLDPDTGAITGSTTQVGAFPVRLRATNTTGTADLDVQVVIAAAASDPTITGPASIAGLVGQPLRYEPTVTGFPLPTVTASGLPAGLVLDPLTGVVSGAPTEAVTGTFTLTATSPRGTASLSVDFSTVPPDSAPTVGFYESTRNLRVGIPVFRFGAGVGGYPAPTYALAPGSDPLPAGVSFDPVTGQFGGMPTERGDATMVVTISNRVGTITATVKLVVRQPPTITADPAPVAVAGEPFEWTANVTGPSLGTCYVAYDRPNAGSVEGLPVGGLALSSQAPWTISGTAVDVGSYVFYLLCFGDERIANFKVTLTVATRPTVAAPLAAQARFGEPFALLPLLGGSPAPTVTATNLPDGLVIDPATGAITGTPTSAARGPVVVTATNAAGSVTRTLDLTVTGLPAPPSVTPTPVTPTPPTPPPATPTPSPVLSCSSGGATRTLKGGRKADRLTGTRRAETILGRGGNDRIDAKGGADCVLAGAGDDRVVGGSGADRIDGGSGRDRIDAGPGDDRVFSRDGVRDVIVCGPGVDTVVADGVDVLRGCENRA